jgi:hypothetical protein
MIDAPRKPQDGARRRCAELGADTHVRNACNQRREHEWRDDHLDQRRKTSG